MAGAVEAAAVAAAKRELRKDMRRLLKSLSPGEMERQSAIVTRMVLARPEYQRCRRLALFLSLPDEVRTRGILQHALSTQRVCFIPRFRIGSVHMDMVRVNSLDDADSFEAGDFGVLQPAEQETREEALESGGLDLVLVPGLAFTAAGERLGRGKGYYDGYLTRCKAKEGVSPPATLALAFAQQMRPHLPTQSHDQRVDAVIFPDA